MDKYNWRYFEPKRDQEARWLQGGFRALLTDRPPQVVLSWEVWLRYGLYLQHGLYGQAAGVALGGYIGTMDSSRKISNIQRRESQKTVEVRCTEGEGPRNSEPA
jgi:hypothetical protein